MPRPGGIKRRCCLTSVCLTSVAYIRSAGGVCGRPAGWRVLADRVQLGRPGSRLPLRASVAARGGVISWRPPVIIIIVVIIIIIRCSFCIRLQSVLARWTSWLRLTDRWRRVECWRASPTDILSRVTCGLTTTTESQCPLVPASLLPTTTTVWRAQLLATSPRPVPLPRPSPSLAVRVTRQYNLVGPTGGDTLQLGR